MPQSYRGVSLGTPGCQWCQPAPPSQEEEKDEMVEKKSWLYPTFKPGGGNHTEKATAQRIFYEGDASE
ncbi:hypothetical protein TYRP_005312 [Tyrophagus putrescentiae]|nr:hypothetical protein TYRP_005312 [Tyrophagus putrescentiae]